MMTMAIKSNKKYSVKNDGHKTSISLVRVFWDTLCVIKAIEGITISAIVESIDKERRDKNLSSAIRCFCIEYVMNPQIRLKIEALKDAERTGADQAGYRATGT